MKVFKKNFKDLFFEFGIENVDDLWMLSLFISEGDKVGSKTTRRFRVVDGDDSEKKSVFIKLDVKSTKLNLDNQCLKVTGIIESGFPEEYVTVGQHHSFDLHINDKLAINKTALLEIHKKILQKSEEKLKSKLYLVVLDDDSCIIANLNETRYDIVAEIPFKGSGKRDSTQRDISKGQYFDSIIKVLQNSDFDKCIVGGPGFEKENIHKYLQSKFSDGKFLGRFIFTQVSSPGISGIKEMIKGGQLKKVLGDVSIQKDSDLMDEFLLHLAKDKPVTYGLIQVKEAIDRNALRMVLISDKFFHENFNEIKNLLLRLEDNKIEYHILNSETEPGRILDNMSGIAAFLYY